jgi:hypothetical protein
MHALAGYGSSSSSEDEGGAASMVPRKTAPPVQRKRKMAKQLHLPAEIQSALEGRVIDSDSDDELLKDAKRRRKPSSGRAALSGLLCVLPAVTGSTGAQQRRASSSSAAAAAAAVSVAGAAPPPCPARAASDSTVATAGTADEESVAADDSDDGHFGLEAAPQPKRKHPLPAADRVPATISGSSAGRSSSTSGTQAQPSDPDASYYYLDAAGAIQGPFEPADMQQWYTAGYFQSDLPVRHGRGGPFVSLATLVEQRGQGFFVQGSDQRQPLPSQQQQQQQQHAAASRPDGADKQSRRRGRELERMLASGNFGAVEGQLAMHDVAAVDVQAWAPDPVDTLSSQEKKVGFDLESPRAARCRFQLTPHARPSHHTIVPPPACARSPQPQPNAAFWDTETGAVVSSSKPSSTHKRKHQINTLAFEAAARDVESMNQKGAASLKTKRETQAKYGW